MTRVRLLTFLMTLIVVGALGTLGIYFAKGYRFDHETLELLPKGLLVANSEPNGAEVYIDSELKTATNNTITLSPGPHKVKIKKEGFLAWEKEIIITKEEVSQVDAFLVSAAPSLSAITFSGALSPVPDRGLTKIAYGIAEGDNGEKAGLWVFETVNLPLGFNRSSRQITNGDMTSASWIWSPDGSEILLSTEIETYLLDASKYTPMNQLVSIDGEVENIKLAWEGKQDKKHKSVFDKLPNDLQKVFSEHAKDIFLSPDENRILYTAGENAEIPTGLVKPFPGSSTQPEERSIRENHKYVYDIKEDKNFLIGNPDDILYWMPDSVNLISPKEGEIKIQDYDGTNKLTIFSGNYTFPHAYPSSSSDRILILTSLGAEDAPTNLYWLSLR